MKNMVILILFSFCLRASGQEIINVVFIDANKAVTKNPNVAKYMVVVKKHHDSLFERIDYNFAGPRMKSLRYTEPELKNKSDLYLEYSAYGKLIKSGNYKNNLKNGDWLEFDFDGKIRLHQVYENDQLIKEVIPDTAKEVGLQKNFEEIESAYPGGLDAYRRFMNRNVVYPARAIQLRMQGTVLLRFMVDTSGKLTNPFISNSVELSLDEEALRIVSVMPPWTTARLNGRKVRSYKAQPITFKLP